MALTEYIDYLSHLAVNKKGTHIAPHKAILLLAIIDLVEKGEIDTPFIPLTKSLEKAFESTWIQYVIDPGHFSCNMNYPFYHLSSAPFWLLVKLPTYEDKQEYSMSSLKKSFAGAMIDENLYQLIRDDNSRSAIRDILISTYINPDNSQNKANGAILSAITLQLLTVA